MVSHLKLLLIFIFAQFITTHSKTLLVDERSNGGIHFLEHVRESYVKQVDNKWCCASSESDHFVELDDPIIVVGTDGSGTRVVAKFLSMLNVTVLVEKSVASQMDVDGQIAGVSSYIFIHFCQTIISLFKPLPFLFFLFN